MDKVLKLYCYVDGINDTPFPSSDNHATITSFKYDSKRMGGAPTISATLMHEQCLDKLWEYNVYATFNGEKYFIKNIPSSSYNNTDILYKHDIELVSERIVLDNVYFYDVVSKDVVNDKPVSNNSKFTFFGDIHEFASRLNYSLQYSKIDYNVVVDDGISSEGKFVSFEDTFFSNAIQESYNTYEIPYYFDGKTIHFGFTNNAITQTFKYGADESLLSIQKQNANYKVVNRVTGTGSSDNIPYYYPNLNEWGIITAQVGWDKEGAGYDWDFSKESELELKVSDVIIVDEKKFATNISPDDRIVCYGFKWHRNTINGEEILLDDIGIKIINHDGNQGCPNSYFWFGQKRMGYAMPVQSNLMPPIYRSTEGEERFYNALNNTYISPETGTYYEFENQYTDGKQKEQIVNFEDIKPSIVGMTNANGQRIDTFLEFAYDENDNDETDEEGNYLHPYFFAKLPKYDGTYGFNLFDHAIDEEEMTISMTSGNCGACEWTVMVDSETLKNTVQVDSDGNLLRDKNGNVSFGAAQDRQNDTINNEVWIALKKDIDTFGVIMPNATNNYKPSAGDTFVILHILLPNSYIFAAENRLKDELIKYMAANNSEKFNFSISFSRIYFAEHTEVLEKLNENSRIQIEYNGELHELYVSSFSYSMDSSSPLPNVTVELSDTLTIQKNALQTAISQVENSIMKNIGSIDWLKLGLAYFLRKDTDDRSRGKVSSDKGFEVGKFVSGTSGAMIYLDKTNNKTVAEVDKIYVRLKAYFEQLEIINENSIGGKQIISPAGSIRCKSVETKDDIDYYRCYILTEQDGDKIENRFKVGDQASCQMFNAKEGVENNISNRYYWRLVVGVGEDYIDLSKSDCDAYSDEPMPNDVICHRGNRNDIDRQNFIEFSSVDSFSPSITLYQGVNNYSLTDKEVIQFGVNKVTGKSFMNVYGDMYVGNRDGSSFIQYTPENGLILKGTLDINTNFGNKTLKDTINEAGNAYKEDLSSLQSSINKDIDNLQSQIDGAIETWFFDPIPTLTNSPASSWTTNEERNKHLGDLYYSGEGRAYRFQLNSESGSYYWNEIVDTDINKALENAKKAQDTADGKRRVFVSQPTNSQAYDIGDIWVNATYPSDGSTYKNDMLRANSKKAEGEPFSIEHWTLASKYTDDTVANKAQEEAAKANKAVAELDSSVRSFKNTVETTFRDGIISESEAKSLSESISQIGALKEQVIKSHDDMSSNSLLKGTTSLTNLSNAKSAFIVSCDELVSAVTSAISDKNITEAERALVNAKYDVYNTKYGDYNKYLSACIRYVEETLNNNISSYNYLKKALKESTTISGGLVQTSAVVLGYTNDYNDYVVMAGTNGVVTSKGNRTPAFWMGGDMIDLFDVYNSVTGNFDREEGVRYATGMDRMDGTGYRANGNLWWDNDGKIHADPLSFFVGDNSVGGLLAAIQVVFKSDGIHPDYLIPQVPFQTLHIADRLRIGDALLKYDPVNKAIYATHVDGSTDTIGFYSEGWVSAKGANPSSGGGSGASALYQLLDVLPNASNDGVLNAVKGSVLTYNGTKWQAGTIHVPTNLSEFVNDSGFITSAAIPTKVSQLNNDAGYITGISKSMVEGVLTGNITSHTHNNYVTLTGEGASGTWNISINGTASTASKLNNALTIQANGTSLGTYDGSAAKTFNLTYANVGAAAAEHTHSQYLTEHQSIYSLTFTAGTFIHDIYTPNSEAKTISIPTTTSHIREGNNLYFTNQRAVDALSATLLGYQPLISDLEIIRNSAAEGHTAYGWGNHANAGYLTGINSTMVVNALGYTPYNSSNPNGYISGITKSMVENVLTGNITSHSHTFASITSKPDTLAGYGISDGVSHKSLFSKADFECYALLLCKVGSSTTYDSHDINGTLYTTLVGGGISRYQAAYINIHCSDWDGGHNESYNFTPFGLGIALRLVTCTYQSQTWLAVVYTNVQGIYAYFDGVVSGMSLTPVKYYNAYSGEVFNSEIYNSISDVSYNKLPFIASSNTVLDSGNYNSYSPTLTGAGASGTWGINISGNAATATKLQTPRTLWGQSFDGTGDVSGSIIIKDTAGLYQQTLDGEYTCYVGYDHRNHYIHFYNFISNHSIRIYDNGNICCPYGNVGIGTVSPSVKLHVIGDIAATGAITAKASSSDIRLKKDISDYKALSIIRSHKSIKYHWNAVAKANADIFKDNYWHYGLIAQEMQKDMPQMVSDVFKDYLVINYERLIPICWKGLQEVDDEVSRLKKKVRKLEMEIRELKQGT